MVGMMLLRRTLIHVAAAATLLFVLGAGCATGGGEKTPGQGPDQEFSYQPFNGVKKRIAVLTFENKVSSRWYDKSWNIEAGITEMLITELMKTGRFIVLERGSINEVMGEQDFGASGRVRAESAAKVGDILGAQLLVKGAVTEFTEKESGGMGGIAIGGVAIGGKSNTGHVALDMRMIDSVSGQILASERAESKITQTGVGGIAFLGPVAFGGAGYKKTSLGKATREAVHKAVLAVIARMEQMPWEGRVVEVKNGKVYINAGSDLNIMAGAVFQVFNRGDELIDPGTGESLGFELTPAGSIRVTSVMQKASVAEAVSGSGFKRGDVLKMQ
jgi:curli biogenesis system outer membrane secretion channel CsgG